MQKIYISEIEDLAEHGITLPPNMQGLTEEQVIELKLKDEWAEKCTPQGGVRENEDKIGRRNGQGKTNYLPFMFFFSFHDLVPILVSWSSKV